MRKVKRERKGGGGGMMKRKETKDEREKGMREGF